MGWLFIKKPLASLLCQSRYIIIHFIIIYSETIIVRQSGLPQKPQCGLLLLD